MFGLLKFQRKWFLLFNETPRLLQHGKETPLALKGILNALNVGKAKQFIPVEVELREILFIKALWLNRVGDSAKIRFR